MRTEQDTEAVVVIFRICPNGDAIALFPELAGDYSGHCTCYAHVGQHGAANYGLVMNQTRPAKPEEYSALKRELEEIGYKLTVRQRRTNWRQRYNNAR